MNFLQGSAIDALARGRLDRFSLNGANQKSHKEEASSEIDEEIGSSVSASYRVRFSLIQSCTSIPCKPDRLGGSSLCFSRGA